MRKRSRGSLIVDAAIAMLAFSFILFASIDFGGAWWRCQTLQSAVLDGARYAIVHGGTDPQPGMRVTASNGGAATLTTYVKAHAYGLNANDPFFTFYDKTTLNLTPEWILPGGGSDPNAMPKSTVHIHASYPMRLTLMKKFAPDSMLMGCQVPTSCEADASMTIIQ